MRTSQKDLLVKKKKTKINPNTKLAKKITKYFKKYLGKKSKKNKCIIIEVDGNDKLISNLEKVNLKELKEIVELWELHDKFKEEGKGSKVKTNGKKRIYFSFNANILPMIFETEFEKICEKDKTDSDERNKEPEKDWPKYKELAKRVVKLPQEWDYLVYLIEYGSTNSK